VKHHRIDVACVLSFSVLAENPAAALNRAQHLIQAREELEIQGNLGDRGVDEFDNECYPAIVVPQLPHFIGRLEHLDEREAGTFAHVESLTLGYYVDERGYWRD
jgi:hypothetical protein